MRLNNIMSAWFVIGRLGLMSHSLVSPPRLHIHTLHALLEFSLPRIFTSTLYLNFQSYFIQVGYWGKVYSSFHNMELLNNSTATLLLWSNAGIDGVSGNYVRLIFEISSNLSIKVISGAGQFHASFFLWFTVPAPSSIGQGHLSLQFFPLIHGATRPVSWAKTTFYLWFTVPAPGSKGEGHLSGAGAMPSSIFLFPRFFTFGSRCLRPDP